MNKFLSLIFFSCLNLSAQELVDLKWINTGSNMTVAILNVNRDLLSKGDTIAVFYNLPDDRKRCGGFVVWNDDRVALTIWGDDNTTSEKDGFYNEEEFSPLYHIKNGLIKTSLNPKFLAGGSYFRHNGISVIENLY